MSTLCVGCGTNAFRVPASAQSSRSDSIPIRDGCVRIEIHFHDGLLAIERGDAMRCDVETSLQAESPATLAVYEAAAAPSFERRPDGSMFVQAALPDGAPMDAVRTAWRLRVPDGASVFVTTRRGAIVARGINGALHVDGGSGVVEANLAGGSADIATTSGSLILRGAYAMADVRSTIGRIDLALPSVAQTPSVVKAQSRRGEIFVDVRKASMFDTRFCGEQSLVRCDAEVRCEWNGTENADGVSWSRGRLGDMAGTTMGTLWITTEAPVYVRLLPENPFEATQQTSQ